MLGMMVPVVLHIEDSIVGAKLHVVPLQHHSKTSKFPLVRDKEKQYDKSQEKLRKTMNREKKDDKVQGSSMLLLGLLQRTDRCVEGNRQKTPC